MLYVGGEYSENQAGDAAHLELFVDSAKVRVHRVRGNSKIAANADFWFSKQKALNDVQLARRKLERLGERFPFVHGQPACEPPAKTLD
jgi:hypothetical protein